MSNDLRHGNADLGDVTLHYVTAGKDVHGGIAEGCGHWIPEERPE